MRNQKARYTKKSAQQGVVIIEAMIAILIFSFAILGLVGLQATMIKNTAESEYRAIASYIAQQQVGRMWADPSNIATSYVGVTTDIPTQLPNGAINVTQAGANTYVIAVTWQKQGEPQHNFTTSASIN